MLLLLAIPSWAAIAVAFHPAGVTHSTASTTCAITTTIGTGNVTIMSVALPTGVTVSGVTDNKAGGTNTYTKGPVADNASGGHVEMWWTLAAGSATIVTAAFASNKNSCAADVYSGVAGVSSVYPTNTGAASGTSTITFSTTAANSWPVVAVSTAPSTLTYTAGTTGCTTNPCVLESTVAGGSVTTPGIGVEDDGNVAAIGSRTLTTTLSLSTKSWAVGAIELMTTLPTPTTGPNGGSFNNDTVTTFSDAISGTAPTFCSTVDGSTTPAASTPGTCSTGATGGTATVIATGNTAKVIATKSGWVNSAVLTSSAFTLTVADPAFGTNGGSFNNDTASTQTSTTTSAVFCQTVDGSTPAAATPGTCSAGTTGASATAIATGAVIKALGTKTNYVNSAVQTSSAFTLTVGAVTDSPGAGTYTSIQSATLGTTTTTGASIFYTVNNSAATCSSTAYSTPISVASTENVRAVSCKTNYVTSGELNDLYTINLPASSSCSFGLPLLGVGCGGGAPAFVPDFSWDMESNATTPWDFSSTTDTGTRLSRASVNPHSGTYALRLTGGGGTTQATIALTGLSYTSSVTDVFYIYCSSDVAFNGGHVMRLRYAGDYFIAVILGNNNQLQLARNKPSYSNVGSAYTFTLGAWHKVKVTATGIGTTSGQVTMYVDDVSRASESSIDWSAGYTINEMDAGIIGGYGSGMTTGTVDFDDGYIDADDL